MRRVAPAGARRLRAAAGGRAAARRRGGRARAARAAARLAGAARGRQPADAAAREYTIITKYIHLSRTQIWHYSTRDSSH